MKKIARLTTKMEVRSIIKYVRNCCFSEDGGAVLWFDGKQQNGYVPRRGCFWVRCMMNGVP